MEGRHLLGKRPVQEPGIIPEGGVPAVAYGDRRDALVGGEEITQGRPMHPGHVASEVRQPDLIGDPVCPGRIPQMVEAV